MVSLQIALLVIYWGMLITMVCILHSLDVSHFVCRWQLYGLAHLLVRLCVPYFSSTAIELFLKLVLKLNLVCWRSALSRRLLVSLIFYVAQEGLALILWRLLVRSRRWKPHTSSTIDRSQSKVIV